ncbi:hypothetical protein C4559_06530 [Candidatus Microgenomates bacterium]|nr:MAG: hypothetical protein C4559_06530 [Candidatus Microgenomates bacterium]
MKGEVILLRHGQGENGYAVKLQGTIFPVDKTEIIVRGLKQGSEVLFQTNRNSGMAEIIKPEPIAGCKV